MDYKERLSIIDKILWGKSIAEVLDGHSNKHTIILRSLTSKENNLVNYIYYQEIEKSKEEGLLSINDLERLYKAQEIWGDKQTEILDNLYQQIKILQADIKDSELFKTKRKRLEKYLKAVREKIEKLESQRESLFIIAYEHRAEEVKRRFMIMLASEKMDGSPFWETEEEFLNDADAQLLYNLALAYYQNNVFSEKQLREIARSSEWRYRWQVAKKGADLFGKPIADWSETQGMLVYWSQFYDGIYESMHFPGEGVVSNDESCDAWVRQQNKSSGVKHNVGDNNTSSPTPRAKKGNNHQEQFLFVEPGDKETVQQVQDMNPEQVRKQLQDEHEYIKKNGKVSEWKLRIARKRGEIS